MKKVDNIDWINKFFIFYSSSQDKAEIFYEEQEVLTIDNCMKDNSDFPVHKFKDTICFEYKEIKDWIFVNYEEQLKQLTLQKEDKEVKKEVSKEENINEVEEIKTKAKKISDNKEKNNEDDKTQKLSLF